MSEKQPLRYPLILVPGLLGFISLLGYHYWYGIVKLLSRHGAKAYPVQVSPVNSTEVRGEQLLARIDDVLARTGAAKVHLLGHSQGALTARYAAAKRPDLVASVTSIAGPNHGSELGDFLQRNVHPDTLRERALNALFQAFVWLTSFLDVGYRGPKLPFDSAAAQHSLTTEGVAEFNLSYPQGLPQVWGGEGEEVVNGVYYFSWSGTLQPGITDQGGNRFDGPNLACRTFAKTFKREVGQCDGMVGRYSSHLGKVIGDSYPLDHFDIVNQSFGLVGKGADPLRLYAEHVERLAATER